MNPIEPIYFEFNDTRPVRLETAAVITLPECRQADPTYRLEEIDQEGRVIDGQVPFQIDPAFENDANSRLIFLVTLNNQQRVRRYHLCKNGTGYSRQNERLVYVEEILYQGQETYKVTTPAATYYFHKQGGGLASIIDPQGNDWISYRPNGGSDGKYRGIPNIKYPENYFHPGDTGSRSLLISEGPVCCRIHTHTIDGVCEAVWEFTPHHIHLHLLKAPRPHWFLYEGTPGGTLKENECFILRSNGVRTVAKEPWEDYLNPAWVCFGSPDSEKVLFLFQENAQPCITSYRPMDHNMTVFGFGRKDMNHYLETLPAHYLIGLLNNSSFENLSAHLKSIACQIIIDLNTTGAHP